MIDNFSSFVTRHFNGNVSVAQTSEGVSFWNNNLSVSQAYVSYCLPFDIFGNITDVSLSFNLHYICSNSSSNFMFDAGLGTHFNPYTEKYDYSQQDYIRNMVKCGIRSMVVSNEYLYVGESLSNEKSVSEESMPSENNVTISILKKNHFVRATIVNSTGVELFSLERNDPHFYAYTNLFYLWYSAFSGTQVTAEVSSLEINLLQEERDWAVEVRNDKIVKTLVTLFITLLVISFIVIITFVFVNSRSFRISEEKRIRQEKRANEEKYRKLAE